MSSENGQSIVNLSPVKFLIGCVVTGLAVFLIGKVVPIPTWVVALEVLLTILILFVFGSIRYRLDKNAVTYGCLIVIIASYWDNWWQSTPFRTSLQVEGASALWDFIHHHFLTLHGLEQLFHADTMLFILGLTFFVAVIAQTRLLETFSFSILTKTKGAVVFTIAILAAVVSFSSGILDGVSMIGLMIRTMVIILVLAKASQDAIVFSVMVSTIITTVCGMWLAYGEPPNLIMKTNLHPHLTNGFFIRYCLPVAVICYFIVMHSVRAKLKGKKVALQDLDVLDMNTADVRFLQAMRHGEVLTPIEFAEAHTEQLGNYSQPLIDRLLKGESLGLAMIHLQIPEKIRKEMLGKYVSEDLSAFLDRHYTNVAKGVSHDRDVAEKEIARSLHTIRKQRQRAQSIGLLSFIPFIGLLIAHGINHEIPLFWASFAGFGVALIGIAKLTKTRKLALHEGTVEYSEYLFLFPLFLSITLLSKTGFFEHITVLLLSGIERFGVSVVAYLQFLGATFLSALLDNNVVADFAGRAIRGMEVGMIHLFAMAQIAGYAAGGCWTHIGSAQSVVAYSFIKKQVNANYTPFRWIKTMTPLILKIAIAMTVIIQAEAYIAKVFKLN